MVEEIKKNWHDKNYKKLLIIPIVILLFSVIYLSNFTSQNQDIVYKDISLKGGTTITVFDKTTDINDLKIFLKDKLPDSLVREISDFRTGEQQAFFVESSSDSKELKSILEDYLGYKLDSENSSTEFTGASISQGFYEQLKFAIILAFIFMAIVVFLIFKTPIPSLAVIISAFSDIVMTIATIDLLGISLSSGGIVALLMLIGYSVDTDILLTTRILRKKGDLLNKRILEAFKTGLTMTLTSILAIFVAYIIIFNLSEVLKQIFTILLFGLGFDLLNTWVTNASILKWYAEVKGIQ